MPIKVIREFIDVIDERKMNLNIRPFVSEKLRKLVELTDKTKGEEIKGTLGQLKDEIKQQMMSDEFKVQMRNELRRELGQFKNELIEVIKGSNQN